MKKFLSGIILAITGYTIAGIIMFALSGQITVPRTPWYWQICQALIQPVMEVFFDGKESRWFHWVPSQAAPSETHITLIPGDPKAPRRGDSWVSNARVSLGMWRTCAIIAPPEDYPVGRPWFFAFKGRNQRCTIELNGPVRILIGPDDTEVFGISSSEEITKLHVIKITKRGDTRYRKYPLI